MPSRFALLAASSSSPPARDELAKLSRLEPTVAALGPGAKLVLAPDADHSFHVPAKGGHSDKEVLAALLDGAAAWMISVANA